MLLEHLHGDAVAPLVALEDELCSREVDVGLVPGADLLDREPEDIGPQPLGDDHVRQNMLWSIPPSTWSETPVMYEARGDAMNTIAAANSSGRP